ncbi:MAG TPA: heavy-metal-associated domain-containing protein [Clostridiaceae bacterium]|nr:heavy-metal-associated domain-containing protein [Clostridiaceae bacterium]
METVTFNIPAVSCKTCAEKIENALSNLQGVEKVSVDLKAESVRVDFKPESVSTEEISKEISNLGFEAVK